MAEYKVTLQPPTPPDGPFISVQLPDLVATDTMKIVGTMIKNAPQIYALCFLGVTLTTDANVANRKLRLRRFVDLPAEAANYAVREAWKSSNVAASTVFPWQVQVNDYYYNASSPESEAVMINKDSIILQGTDYLQLFISSAEAGDTVTLGRATFKYLNPELYVDGPYANTEIWKRLKHGFNIS